MVAEKETIEEPVTKKLKVDEKASTGFASFAKKAGNGFGDFATKKNGDGFSKKDDENCFVFKSASITKNTEDDGSKKAAVGDANFNYSNGEDGENCIVQIRCKLFKLVDKKWCECGIGPLRLLESKSNETRIVMRRETSVRGPGHKLLMNYRMSCCKKADLEDEKNIRLGFLDKNEDKVVATNYVIRAENAQDAESLHVEMVDRMTTT